MGEKESEQGYNGNEWQKNGRHGEKERNREEKGEREREKEERQVDLVKKTKKHKMSNPDMFIFIVVGKGTNYLLVSANNYRL